MFENRIKQLLKESKKNRPNESYIYKFLQPELKKLDKNHNSCEIPNLFNMDFLQKKLFEIDSNLTAIPTGCNTIKISI